MGYLETDPINSSLKSENNDHILTATESIYITVNVNISTDEA